MFTETKIFLSNLLSKHIPLNSKYKIPENIVGVVS